MILKNSNKLDVLFVLGMHRSGTSFLARCLMEMGLSFDLPTIQEGYWEKHVEYYDVNRLNDKILTSWKEPLLDQGFVRSQLLNYEVKQFVRKNIPCSQLVGVKDPRFLLTFDYWKKHVDNFKIIGIFRRPEEVAKSLSIRDEYGKASFSQGLDLWKKYNNSLLELHNKYQFPLINFNDDKNSICHNIENAFSKLDLNFSKIIFKNIFNEKKKNQFSENIPREYSELYDSLVAASIT